MYNNVIIIRRRSLFCELRSSRAAHHLKNVSSHELLAADSLLPYAAKLIKLRHTLSHSLTHSVSHSLCYPNGYHLNLGSSESFTPAWEFRIYFVPHTTPLPSLSLACSFIFPLPESVTHIHHRLFSVCVCVFVCVSSTVGRRGFRTNKPVCGFNL